MSKKTIAKGSQIEVLLEDDKCYKIFNNDYSKVDILNEALNIATIEKTGLNIPHLHEICMTDGKWTLVIDYAKGRMLSTLFEENPDKEDEYLELFVDHQMDIHTKRCPTLSKHNDKMNRKISETNLSATLRYDLHKRIEEMPKHNYLCHGDFNPTNIIIDEDGNTTILDWSHATIGNVEADVARTYMMFMIDGKKERARKYIDLFSKKSGTPIEDILAWLPILAASQSVKDIKDQKEFLNDVIFMDKKELMELYEQI